MFPDSKIASNFKMSEKKCKYLVQFGIAKFVLEEIIDDFADTPFSFMFDETTTVQVKKQFDGYVRFYSKKFNKIISPYVGSVFIGHCNAEQIKDHFYELGHKIKWNINYLLHVGMDGPNINLLFIKNLTKELLENNNKFIINISSCALHPVHTGFIKCLAKIDFDYDSFAHDLLCFFKHSSARRQDFELMSLSTEIETQFMLRHVNSRWLSLGKILSRILHQWSNLKEYFLKFLPKEKNFSREIAPTDRYKRISRILSSDMSEIYISFAIHISECLESFLLNFESDSPKIHVLFPAIGDLFYKIMSKFVKKKYLIKDTGKGTAIKDAHDLGKFNFSKNTDSLLSIHDIDYGTKTKYAIAQIESKTNLDNIKTQFENSFLTLIEYLQSRMPHDNTLLHDIQYIHPKHQLNSKSLSAISRVAAVFVKTLKNTKFLGNLSCDQYVDMVRDQYKLYQTENIDNIFEEYKSNIESFWNYISSIKDVHDKFKFKELSAVVRACLCLNHSNVTAERGFSLNKGVLSDRESLKTETIESLRLVKDYLNFFENIYDFPITKKLITYAKQSRECYNTYLQGLEKARIEKNQKKAMALENSSEISVCKKKSKSSHDEELQLLQKKIKEEKSRLKISEDLLSEGNSELEAAIKKSFNKILIAKAQLKIKMAVQNTNEIKVNLNKLLDTEKNLLLQKHKN
ncbi:MAG TPA: hypothetical protein DDZ41_05870 [Flavobacterium sp.]|nr:hypothetical protein [Flavobacterium sp.]